MTLVAIGIIRRNGLHLIGKRSGGRRHPLRWEFPGGKVKPNETPEAGLKRELKEELGIEAEVGPEIYRCAYPYDPAHVKLLFFTVDAFKGEPQMKEHVALEWVPKEELGAYHLLNSYMLRVL